MIGQLLQRANQRFSEIYSGAAGRGPTRTQYAVLSALADRKPATQADIIERTGIDRSTLSEMLVSMQFSGLVHRTRGTSDARTKLVTITNKGSFALAGAKRAEKQAQTEFLNSIPRVHRAHFEKALAAAAQVTNGEAQ